jgi:hypothetical protein
MERALMRRFMAAVVAALVLALPGSALAGGSSTCQAYNPQLCGVNGATATSSGAKTANESLPFTGLDVALLVAGGGALLGAGLVVRTLSRRLN